MVMVVVHGSNGGYSGAGGCWRAGYIKYTYGVILLLLLFFVKGNGDDGDRGDDVLM